MLDGAEAALAPVGAHHLPGEGGHLVRVVGVDPRSESVAGLAPTSTTGPSTPSTPAPRRARADVGPRPRALRTSGRSAGAATGGRPTSALCSPPSCAARTQGSRRPRRTTRRAGEGGASRRVADRHAADAELAQLAGRRVAEQQHLGRLGFQRQPAGNAGGARDRRLAGAGQARPVGGADGRQRAGRGRLVVAADDRGHDQSGHQRRCGQDQRDSASSLTHGVRRLSFGVMAHADPQTVVMKFGGTSVADAERIKRAAKRIVQRAEEGSRGSRCCPHAASTPTSRSRSHTRSPSARTRARWTCCSRPASASPARWRRW